MFGRLRRGGANPLDLAMAGLPAPVEIRRDRRARRFTLRVNEARREAVLTMPLKVSMKEAAAFLGRHRDWLRGRLEALPEVVPFADGADMPLRGELHIIRFVGKARGRGVVWTEAGCATSGDGVLPLFSVTPTILVAGGAGHAPRRLTDWLKREARGDLVARVACHARAMGLTPGRVTVRDQASRWGSCSTTGALNFSWRLILAPPFVLDYVAAHEVAHLKEMNHGPRFWRLVAKTVPRLDEARAWLKADGIELHRYGAGS